ncbi:MAG TPA: hypothetical protein VM327_08810 [Candidatus Thermoplasmatota archaeon]|nr:hypothetical protein [Candidatus Thermoplasmatota archaeon]
MDRTGLARLGLWVFTAGIFAWIFPNVADGLAANVATDIAIVIGGALAAIGLPRAVAGLGTGLLRWGLAIVALCQGGQNLITAATRLDGVNAAPVFVVLAASIALAFGIRRWQEDGWDGSATPWLAVGFAGFAFEPVYYVARGFLEGGGLGPYFAGSVGVAVGAALAAWAFRPGEEDEIESSATEHSPPRRARA